MKNFFINLFDSLNLFRNAKKIYENITGFKSSCVAFCYSAFTTIILICLLSTIIFYIFCDVEKTGALLKDTLAIIITPSLTFFSIAVGCIFGATAVENKQEEQEA